jgi:hypothetical protein
MQYCCAHVVHVHVHVPAVAVADDVLTFFFSTRILQSTGSINSETPEEAAKAYMKSSTQTHHEHRWGCVVALMFTCCLWQ